MSVGRGRGLQKRIDVREVARQWSPWALATGLAIATTTLATARVAAGSPADALARLGRFGLDALLTGGMKDDDLVAAGHVGLLVRAGAVHTSWSHLVVNTVAFVLIGLLYWRLTAPSRRTLTSAALMIAIALCASSAGFFVSFLAGSGPSCGASAGVYGLFGAIAGAVWVQRRALPERLRLAAPLALTALALASALVLLPDPGMDHAAHLGGLGAGLGLGIATQHRIGRRAIGALAAALLFVALF